MKKGLRVLLAADGFVLFAFGLLIPIYAIFVEEIGGDVLDAGITYAVYLFFMGVFIYFVSRWENHQKHKEKLLIFSYVLFCFGAIGYFFVTSKYHLFLVQAIVGAAEAFNSPVYDGLYSKFLDKGKFVSEWGLYASMRSFVTAFAALAGGALAFYFGFKALFTVMLVFSILGLLISLRLKRINKIGRV
ncbi:MAG: MFS transporter [archaeon]